MARRWQYPQWFEPVSTSPERATPDKWHRQQPDPLYVRSVHAVIATCVFFVQVVSVAPETVTVDKWFRRTSEPVRTVPYLHAVTPHVFFVPKPVVDLSWHRQTETPIWVKDLRHTRESFFYFHTQLKVIMAWSRLGEIPRGKPDVRYTHPSLFFDFQPIPEAVAPSTFRRRRYNVMDYVSAPQVESQNLRINVETKTDVPPVGI